MRKSLFIGAFFPLALAAAAGADVSFEQEAKFGGLAKIMTMGKPMKTVTYISADKMRTDSGRVVQILDLAAEKIYDLDTKERTYTVMTFEEMRQKMKAAMASVKKEAKSEAPDVSARAEIDLTQTGKTENIAGYPCKQVLLQVDLTLKDEKNKQEGTMSMVTDAWLAEGAPGVEEMNAFYRKMAEKLGTTELAREVTSGQDAQSTQFTVAMRRSASELKNMNGFPMRSTYYFGSAEAAKKEAMSGGSGQEKKGGGLGGFLKKMPVPGQEQEEAQGQEGQPGGGVLMKMTVETKRIDAKSVEPSLFTVPQNFKQVTANK